MPKIFDKRAQIVLYYPEGVSIDVTGHHRANAELAQMIVESWRKGYDVMFPNCPPEVGEWKIVRMHPPISRKEVFHRLNCCWDDEQFGLGHAPNMERLCDLLCEIAGIPEELTVKELDKE